MIARPTVTLTHRAEPVLGSRLECRIIAHHRRGARRAVRDVIDELERWEQRLSVYRPSSELRAWIDGTLDDHALSPELRLVLARAKHWERATDGVLSPLATAGSSNSAYRLNDDDRVRRAGDLTGLRLDAFAKGFIVDRALEGCMRRRGVIDAVISLGGDVRAMGPFGVTVGVEHPGRPYDNEPPIARVEVRNSALATSGRSRRGDHLLDGRTGRTIDFTGSAAVRANTLEVADAWATALCVDNDLAVCANVESMLFGEDGATIASTR